MLKRASLLVFVISCYVVIKLLVPDDLEPSQSLTDREFNADYQMEKVTSIHFNEQGFQSYNLTANKINYSNQQQHSEFIQPKVQVAAEEALITLESPIAYSENLTTLTFPGEVVINSQQKQQNASTTIHTANLTANFKQKSIDTDEKIEILSVSDNSRSSLSGKGLSMDLEQNLIRIKQDLRSQLEIKPQDNDDKK